MYLESRNSDLYERQLASVDFQRAISGGREFLAYAKARPANLQGSQLDGFNTGFANLWNDTMAQSTMDTLEGKQIYILSRLYEVAAAIRAAKGRVYIGNREVLFHPSMAVPKFLFAAQLHPHIFRPEPVAEEG